MPDPDDIVNRIDDAITSPDAMRSRPGPEPTAEDPQLVVLLTMTGPAMLRLERDDAAGHVAELVGDPGVDRCRLGIADVFVGDNSRARQERNRGAEFVVEALLRAIVDGEVAAPDRVRDHAAHLISTEIPVIHGAAVLTGPAGDDGVPTSLPANIVRWFSQLALRVQVYTALRAIAAGQGEVTIVVLGD